MTSVLPVLVLVACAGLLALSLISGDLARRNGLSGPARVLLSAGIGMGVIAVTIKVVLVGSLMTVAEDHHPAVRPAGWSETIVRPGFGFDSVITGKWHALPAAVPGAGDEPPSPAVVALGRRLFDEPGLSVDGTVACRSCHRLDSGGDDNAAVSTGIRGLRGTRNAPTVWNAAFLSRLFWDGRASSLEEQAKGPLVNPVEMGMPSYATVEAAVRGLPGYPAAFAQAFGRPRAVTIDNIARAIAGYERTLIAPDTAYDRFVRGDQDVLSDRQLRGMALFAGLGCRGCHRDPTFSAAGTVKPAGVRRPFPVFVDSPYVGRYDLLVDRGAAAGGDPGHSGLWRVPSLRNVANTAPYFHNGSVATLEEAVRVMAATQLGKSLVAARDGDDPSVSWDPATRRLTPLRPVALSDDDVAALADFLRALSVPDQTGSPGAGTTASRESPRPAGTYDAVFAQSTSLPMKSAH